jgi:hypothetical protein
MRRAGGGGGVAEGNRNGEGIDLTRKRIDEVMTMTFLTWFFCLDIF